MSFDPGILMVPQYAVTTGLSIGLKSRPGNCPCALVVEESGVRVIGGRKFSDNKDAGCNASELRIKTSRFARNDKLL